MSDRDEPCSWTPVPSPPQQAALISVASGLPIDDGRTLALQVDRWAGVHDEPRRSVVATLTLYECDVDVAGAAGPEGDEDLVLARFTLTLDPPAKPRPGRAPGPCAVAGAERTDDSDATRYFYSGSKEWLALRLGGKSFRVHLPEDVSEREGAYFEIGFVLEGPGPGGEPVRLVRRWKQGGATGATASLRLRVLEDEHWWDDWAKRGASAAPERRSWLARLRQFEPWQRFHAGRDARVERDGALFQPLLGATPRRAFVRRMAEENPTIRAARALGADPSGRAVAEETGLEVENLGLGTWDTAKAYFVLHDTGAYATGNCAKAGVQPYRDADKSVHGFLDPDGTYVPVWDFRQTRSGTVFDRGTLGSMVGSRRGERWFKGYGIHIELAPLIALVPKARGRATSADQLRDALRAYLDLPEVDHVTVWRSLGGDDYVIGWTVAMIEALADLYVYASARAAHLLTVTAHQEMDRNLVRAVIDPEYAGSRDPAVEAGIAFVRKRLHSDPRGLDVQRLYDAITRRLQALGGAGAPSGSGHRYGIHPTRVRAGADARPASLAHLDEAIVGLPAADQARVGLNVGNDVKFAHTFPRQSAVWGQD